MAIRNVVALQDTYVDSRLRREGEKFTVDDSKVPVDGVVIGSLDPEPEPEPETPPQGKGSKGK